MVKASYIQHILKKKILILAGSMGTSIQQSHPSVDDFGGEKFVGCNDYLNITRPDLVKRIYKDFLNAGADIIETNSFGSSSIVLQEYGLAAQSYHISKAAASIAKQATSECRTSDKPRLVAGSVGPTNRMINIGRNISFDTLKESYKIQIKGLIDGGADLILFETFHDTSNLKAAVIALKELEIDKDNERIPFMMCVTILDNGRLLSGQKLDAFYSSVRHFNPLAIGLNCGSGPKQTRCFLKQLDEISEFNVAVFPNAGIPDENNCYSLSPIDFAYSLKAIAMTDGLNIVGGCCGTTPEHIHELCKAMKEIPPRNTKNQDYSFTLAGVEDFQFREQEKPYIIGERANMSGALTFRRLIRNSKFEEAAEVAFRQERSGAHIIDVNLSDTESDELENIEHFYPFLRLKIKAPVMIDSANGSEYFQNSMTYLQGKCILNSVNIGNPERFRKMTELAKLYGAALVVILIDKEGMALTLERKIEVARASFRVLVDERNFPAEDIIFDPLVFPLGTGDIDFYRSSEITIDSVASIKKEFPFCKVLLGVSNCSFGLPPAGREAVNAAYLHLASKKGLDFAIMNVEKMISFEQLPAMEQKLCKSLVLDNSDKNVKVFTEFYRNRKHKRNESLLQDNLTVEGRLEYYIINGIRTDLTKQLDKGLEVYTPLQIINTVLMKGMNEVGKRFNAHKVTVIEVLQSAGVMKAAVDYLEQFIESNKIISKGKMLLATVKGDVHDIGKNIAEIVLSNNGYEVIDLGIKISVEELIGAVKKIQPDIIGLSGLLVRSALEMVNVAERLTQEGISIPLMVGGAVLSEKFVETKIQPFYSGPVLYARDAVKGLMLMDELFVHKKQEEFYLKAADIRNRYGSDGIFNTIKSNVSEDKENVTIQKVIKLPQPVDFIKHTLNDVPLHSVFNYLNNQMLYGKHFGLTGGYDKRIADNQDEKIAILVKDVEEVKQLAAANQLIKPRAVYRFFPAKKDGNDIVLFENYGEKEIARFCLPRQKAGDKFCLSDYLAENNIDSVALMCTTAGGGIAETCKAYKDKGEYATSHILYSIALESAEALAEICHREIREQWGLLEEADTSIKDVLLGHYRGKRYSPGYSCWPELADQKKIFSLLDISAEIGVTLTDGMMMDPEASITAMVFHHPEAKYFDVT